MSQGIENAVRTLVPVSSIAWLGLGSNASEWQQAIISLGSWIIGMICACILAKFLSKGDEDKAAKCSEQRKGVSV